MKLLPAIRLCALTAVLTALPLLAEAQSSPTLPNVEFGSGVNKINNTGTYFSDGRYSPLTNYNFATVNGNYDTLNFATGASAVQLGAASGGNDYIHVTGGTIGDLGIGINNVATIDGGTVTQAVANDFSTLNINYGHYDQVEGEDNAFVNVRGGDISYLLAGDSSTINVYGQNLAINGDTITGILENGATLDAQITKGGNYNLIPTVANVPEASSMVSFGLLLLLGGAGLAWRRKGSRAPHH